jgi:hypothetical protein
VAVAACAVEDVRAVPLGVLGDAVDFTAQLLEFAVQKAAVLVVVGVVLDYYSDGDVVVFVVVIVVVVVVVFGVVAVVVVVVVVVVGVGVDVVVLIIGDWR